MNQNLHEEEDINCSLCEHVERTLVALEVHYVGVHGVVGSPTETEEPAARLPLERGHENNFFKLNNDPWWFEYEEISSDSLPITATEYSISSQAPTESLSIDVVFHGIPPKPPTIELSSDTAPSTTDTIPSFSNISGTEVKETTTDAAKYTCEFCEVKNFTCLDLERHQLAVHRELGFGIPETDSISLPEKPQKPKSIFKGKYSTSCRESL